MTRFDKQLLLISIHAPRTGSDSRFFIDDSTQSISIHAPRTGSDNQIGLWSPQCLQFQSTLPARGATGATLMLIGFTYFNPRSPHGERPRSTASSIACC